ncbi:TIGR01620 family protein [Xaviernesmea oryzae]|uniref:TIGR01620 family protein n=1 Tax=Xaviernesmea oryzae TaxID=464029 RepID=A0A1Q9B090_9HYPH|nr:TIGR01620 family protein [Xaviernesmea oryzae]OLP61398.1 TIGR01620 family protein [Xaviernesmea oryzae]SEL70788.1 putative membrane protein [Xaviernesmea oryzae]
MTSEPPRRPAAFSLEPDASRPETPPAAARRPAAFDEGVQLTLPAEDPFAETTLPLEPIEVAEARVLPRRRRFSFIGLASGALGVLVSLALGLWIDQLVRDLFARSDALGMIAIAAVVLLVIGVLTVAGRELAGIFRLANVQTLKADALAAATQPTAAPARKVVDALTGLLKSRAQTAAGRAALKATEDEIIDGPQLLDLAERELLTALDRDARVLILGAAKRVSLVTAVSPRALVDLGYVVYESARLIRAVAELYGARPGTLGSVRLIRDVLAHLAVTGSIAAGDSLVQQVLGHGLASRLSARLGEGVINGLMTARIGIAAMDVCRPMPFRALRRPGIGDFLGDLTPGERKV